MKQMIIEGKKKDEVHHTKQNKAEKNMEKTRN